MKTLRHLIKSNTGYIPMKDDYFIVHEEYGEVYETKTIDGVFISSTTKTVITLTDYLGNVVARKVRVYLVVMEGKYYNLWGSSQVYVG